MNYSFQNSHGLYPLKFIPEYMARIWGGNMMHDVLGRQLPESETPIGESWELCDRQDEQSVVANGPLAGKTLHELFQNHCADLAGRLAGRFHRFPLLVKLIDAGSRLSLQVHPDEEACRRLNDGSEPKTEAWYIIASGEGAKIFAGLNSRTTRLKIMELLDSAEIESQLQVYPSAPGDAYYITAGTLHAIGAGNLILEIQQNSDTTFRVNDWGRVGADGKPRQLHKEAGLASINFSNRSSMRIAGAADNPGYNRKYDVVKNCPFFKIVDLRLQTAWLDTTAPGDSFHLLSLVHGTAAVKTGNGEEKLQAGESILIPACTGKYEIIPSGDGGATVVKTTL